MTNELYKKDLKIQALKEKIASLTANYEDQVANLRVELTILDEEKNELAGQLVQYTQPRPEVVDGEVVEDEHSD